MGPALIVPTARPEIQWRDWHQVALDIVEKWPAGRILDIPSKEGALPSRLVPLGFRCVCGDIEPGNYKAEAPIVRLDLNSGLPFSSGCFDYVTFIEGIEHLLRPYDAIGEVARVLRTGGRLVISTPNILNLRSRMRFLLAGHHLRFNRFSPGGHVLALSYRELQHFLRLHDLEIVQLTTDRKRRKSWPIHFPLKWLTSYFTRRYNDFADVALRDELTDGRTLILVAEKT
jgi:SAM-dependent methyltransferase